MISLIFALVSLFANAGETTDPNSPYVEVELVVSGFNQTEISATRTDGRKLHLARKSIKNPFVGKDKKTYQISPENWAAVKYGE